MSGKRSGSTPVGLDLGRANLRLVRLAAGPEPAVACALCAPTPPGAFDAAGRVVDAGALTAALAELVAQADCQGADAHVTSSCTLLSFEEFTAPSLPGASPDELAAVLLSGKLSTPDSATTFTAQVLSTTESVSQIAACAAPTAWVQALDDVVAAAGLEPVVVELPAFAAALGLAWAAPLGPGRYVLLDLGAGQVTWSVADNGEVRAARSVPLAPSPLPESALAPDAEPGTDPYLSALAALVSECGPADGLALLGGGALRAGLRADLEELTGLPTFVAAPAVRGLGPDATASAPAWLTALGLAARERVE